LLYIQNTNFSTNVDEVFISSLEKSCFSLGKLAFITGTGYYSSIETLASTVFQVIFPMEKVIVTECPALSSETGKRKKNWVFHREKYAWKGSVRGEIGFLRGRFPIKMVNLVVYTSKIACLLYH
jgi:hypothetical protein